MHPLDPYRAAWLLIQQYGSDALLHAEERSLAIGMAGDLEGKRVWLEVAAAVRVLERREAEGGGLNAQRAAQTADTDGAGIGATNTPGLCAAAFAWE